MIDSSGRMPGWNLALRFVLELASFAGLAWYGWHSASGLAAPLLAVALPVLAMTLWGVFAVPGDPSRSGRAPVPVPGGIRLGLELLIFGAGVAAYAAVGATVVAWILAALNVLHLAFATDRIRWLLRQRPPAA